MTFIDDQIQIITAYRDGVPIEMRDLDADEDHPYVLITKVSHSGVPYAFNFGKYHYRIQPPRAELWIVWNVHLNRVVQTGPFESAADASSKCIDFARGPRAPGEVVDQYIPVRVHTDATA